MIRRGQEAMLGCLGFTVDRLALIAAARTVLERPSREPALLTLQTSPGCLSLAYSDGLVDARAHVPAVVDGPTAGQVGGRLFRQVVEALAGKTIEVIPEDDSLMILSGRSRFGLFAGPPDPVAEGPPDGGVTVDATEYLGAFQSVVSMIHGHEDVSEQLIRIGPDGSDLRLDFHTFDFASTDLISGQAGSFGGHGVLVRAGALASLVSRFQRGVPLIRVISSSSNAIWFVGDIDRHGVRIEACTRLSVASNRNADPLFAQDRPNVLRIDAGRLRGAMKRCDLAQRGGSTGHFATFRVGEGADTCTLLAQGWASSAAETIPCTYEGSVAEYAVRFADLAAAIRPVGGALDISFGDPGRPIVLGDSEQYRCLLRPLATRSPDEPRFADSANNLRFPGDRRPREVPDPSTPSGSG